MSIFGNMLGVPTGQNGYKDPTMQEKLDMEDLARRVSAQQNAVIGGAGMFGSQIATSASQESINLLTKTRTNVAIVKVENGYTVDIDGKTHIAETLEQVTGIIAAVMIGKGAHGHP